MAAMRQSWQDAELQGGLLRFSLHKISVDSVTADVSWNFLPQNNGARVPELHVRPQTSPPLTFRLNSETKHRWLNFSPKSGDLLRISSGTPPRFQLLNPPDGKQTVETFPTSSSPPGGQLQDLNPAGKPRSPRAAFHHLHSYRVFLQGRKHLC